MFCYSFSINSLYAEYVETQYGWYEITLYNESSDTLYLFDRYLQQCCDYTYRNNIKIDSICYGYYYESIYLHRYSKKTRRCKLSLKPILENLIDVPHRPYITSGLRKLSYENAMTYSFLTILPHKTISFFILKKAILSKEYTIDKSTNKYYKDRSSDKWIHLSEMVKLDVVKRELSQNVVYLELAIYNDISQLSKTRHDLGFEINAWLNQQFDYEILSIPIKIN